MNWEAGEMKTPHRTLKSLSETTSDLERILNLAMIQSEVKNKSLQEHTEEIARLR